jgi:hypothetical protein
MTNTVNYEVNISDVEYIRHGDQAYLARVYQPKGQGPFPLVIDLHGGAWCKKDRMSDEGTDQPLAQSGVVVASLDFRMPPQGQYPSSLQDVNYAIRWFKSQAKQFNIDPKRVGILGVSSGGHQAMLTAMRPHDPRYNSLPLKTDSAVDATVQCAVMCWPVIDPLGRYEYAQSLQQGEHAKKAKNWIDSHNLYWPTLNDMAEANPTRALERGEAVVMPPVIYLQGTADLAHPVLYRDRFIEHYKKAGGSVALHLFEGMGEAFITTDPQSSQARDAIAKIISFVHQQIG